MFKTIKSKMIFSQTIMILIVLGIMFVCFVSFYEDYYFNRKMQVMKEAFNTIQTIDIEKEINEVPFLDNYQLLKIKLLITDEKFNVIYPVKINKKDKIDAPDEKQVIQKENNKLYSKIVNNRIIRKADKYTVDFVTRNGNKKVSGRGIIEQNHHKYYVYMYEMKAATQIRMSYFNIFFVVVLVSASVVGIIVSFFVSGKISKPIKQIERDTRSAVKNGYNINISQNQDFKELSGLAESINTMMDQIRVQIETLEQEIEKKTNAENIRRQFVNNVSHEMKTPLAIISNQVEMLELLKDEDKKKRYYQSIIEETENMSEMINEMIVIYSIQSDEQNLKVVESDICQLVEYTCRDFDKLFEGNQIDLHEEYEDDCMAMVNEKFITQAVSNYITNAIKHSIKNGNVYVRVFSNEDFVRVEVDNEGPKIPPNHKDGIWDMFYQGNDNETLNGQKGSGLGLYLVRSIMELHNGIYGCENLEKGVRFYIEIPKMKISD